MRQTNEILKLTSLGGKDIMLYKNHNATIVIYLIRFHIFHILRGLCTVVPDYLRYLITQAFVCVTFSLT